MNAIWSREFLILFLFCGLRVTNADFQKNISKLIFKENVFPSEAAKHNTL